MGKWEYESTIKKAKGVDSGGQMSFGTDLKGMSSYVKKWWRTLPVEPSPTFRASIRVDHPRAVEIASKLYALGVTDDQIEWIEPEASNVSAA